MRASLPRHGLRALGCGALRRSSRAAIPALVAGDHDVLAEVDPVLPAATILRLERRLGARRRPWRFATLVSLAAAR